MLDFLRSENKVSCQIIFFNFECLALIDINELHCRDDYGHHVLEHHIAACTQTMHFPELPNVDSLTGILDAL